LSKRRSDGKVYDCVVVGGGPAGLSAALYMGRMRRSVLVVDSDGGRSNWHQVNRNYLGFPDGVHATALRDIGRKQAGSYGAKFLEAKVREVRSEGEGRDRRFYLKTGVGEEVVSRTLIIATGVRDDFPEFDGSDECIGRSIFWCIICDGYEAIDKRILVLGHGSRAASLALQLLVFTPHVTLVAWDGQLELEDKQLQALQEHNITVYDCDCASFSCASVGMVTSVRLDTGEEIEFDMLFVAQRITPSYELANQLNLMCDKNGFVVVDAEAATNMPGVFAAGDVTRLYNHQISSAVHEGGMAAAAANHYLYEDWQQG
jgi:thioredoxin reductase (NADPH)